MAIIPSCPGVYKITCTATGKAYIGSTTDLRKRKYWHWGDLRQGRHHNRYLQNAWNKYGAECFTFEVLETVMFAEYLHEREQYWLDRFKSYDPKRGFNTGDAARAPWLGRSHSEETRQKLSEIARRRGDIKHAQPYAAEWHSSAAGREWHRQHGAQVWEGREPVEKMCECCGRSYQTLVPHHSRFCSDLCRNRMRQAQRLDHVERQCVVCGQPFECQKRYPTQTCSARCAATLRHRNERGRFER